MNKLLGKLNYKEQERIALLNADEKFYRVLFKELKGITVDREIDQRYPYEFMVIFVKSLAEVDSWAPVALHNLLADGILWFCYPKKTSKKYSSDLERDILAESLIKFDFYGIRLVAIDDDWSAMRFRNSKYIKSISGRIPSRPSKC